MLLPATQTASIQRPPGAVPYGQTASQSTVIPTLTLRGLPMGAGINQFLFPASTTFMQDTFGVSVQQPAMVIADWQAAWTSDFPIKPKDHLTLANGSVYQVHGVRTYPGDHIEIYIGVELT
jgi:hypothetical protein